MEAPLTVLQFESAGRGGMARYVSGLSKPLCLMVDLSIATTIDSEDYTGMTGLSVFRVLRSLEDTRGRSGFLRQASLAARYCRNMVTLAKLVFRTGPSITHLQTASYLTDWPFLPVLRAIGTKVVITAHDVYPHKWLLPSWMRWFELLSLRLFYRFSNHIIVHTRAGQGQLSSEFGVPEDRVTVLHHGATPRPIMHVPGGEALRILFFGGVHPYKGLDLALRGLAQVKTPFVLTVAGRPGKEDYLMKCRDMADELGIGRQVTWIIGYVKENDVDRLFSETDLCILPYRRFDSQSGVLFDALSRGVPVLTSGVGGLGEVVSKNGVGIVFEEVNDFISRVEWCARNRDLLELMGRQAIDLVAREFSWNLSANSHAALYSTLLSGERQTL